MRNRYFNGIIHTMFPIILIVCSFCTFAQQKIKPNEYYKAVKGKQSLDSIFPADHIESITVSNNSGTHTLTESELIQLKEQLRNAKYTGSLQVKPGHITLSIRLRSDSKAKPGNVYAYTGMINFDGATDKLGNRFSGTYYLPLNINFDNYR
ncbi:MAG: hypothetical protein HOP30_17760 [Cyclobacteriaceae bacterium]|nr:hypothetical protein [Cyclobacteriaceae bacterium]